MAELEAPIARELRDLFLAGLALLLASLALAWLLARQIARAVAAIVSQAQALARGEPVAAVPSLLREKRIIDEALADASAQLTELTTDLEAKVAERTGQLVAEMQQRADMQLQGEIPRKNE